MYRILSYYNKIIEIVSFYRMFIILKVFSVILVVFCEIDIMWLIKYN